MDLRKTETAGEKKMGLDPQSQYKSIALADLTRRNGVRVAGLPRRGGETWLEWLEKGEFVVENPLVSVW
jgi:hypothetical protein